MCENDPSSPVLDNVWEIAQHLSESDGLPFLLHIEDIQMSIDYSASHHNCCWTRAMLHPIWETFQKNCIHLMDEKVKDNTSTRELLPDSSSSSSLPSPYTPQVSLCMILNEISESIQLLFKRQQQERPLSSAVNRIRYIYRPPSVIRVGKGITGKLAIKFSLHRSDNSDKASKSKLFPSFIAVEPVESIASFVTLSVLEKRRRSSTCSLALLPLQNITNDNKVALYSSFDAELHFNTLPTNVSSSSSLYKEPWMFRIYAAFYNSSQEQILLDEPFMHLCEWRPKVTQEERFAVMNPQMDPNVAFSTEKRHRATMQRHLKSAIERMDGAAELGGETSTPIIRSTLRHIATLQTLQSIPMEICSQPGNSTLAAVMPKDMKWPLHLVIGDLSSKRWRPSPIPGSSSLERLACEMKKMEEHLSECGNDDDGDNDRIKKKKKVEDKSI